MNEAASTLGKRSAKARKKRLGKKGMSDAMRALANIFELEHEHHWTIEHSKDTDAHGFKSYRIVQEVKTLAML